MSARAWYLGPVEPLSLIVISVLLGGTLVALERGHQLSLERKRARAIAPSPVPGPGPGPGPGPLPGPEPTPEPTPVPEPSPKPPSPEQHIVIPQNAWKDQCWWDDSPADVYLDPDESYIVTWPVAWAGDEPVEYYLEPADLADTQASAYWVGDNVFVDIVIRPKRKGWATLMVMEGESGAQAVKGEVPWRAQCLKLEVK
jgi:hypothetical protein